MTMRTNLGGIMLVAAALVLPACQSVQTTQAGAVGVDRSQALVRRRRLNHEWQRLLRGLEVMMGGGLHAPGALSHLGRAARAQRVGAHLVVRPDLRRLHRR